MDHPRKLLKIASRNSTFNIGAVFEPHLKNRILEEMPFHERSRVKFEEIEFEGYHSRQIYSCDLGPHYSEDGL